jgi:hypothetical protein
MSGLEPESPGFSASQCCMLDLSPGGYFEPAAVGYMNHLGPNQLATHASGALSDSVLEHRCPF